jgi:hypothetical protein
MECRQRCESALRCTLEDAKQSDCLVPANLRPFIDILLDRCEFELPEQGLSREVEDRAITVNNIQPGPIDPDLNPVAAAAQKASRRLISIAQPGA